MKEIVIDWGLDKTSFKALSKQITKTYRKGLTTSANSIVLDNDYAEGEIEYFSLRKNISFLRFSISVTEHLKLSTIVKAYPDFYTCLFYNKGCTHLRVYGDATQQAIELGRIVFENRVDYFSANVPTSFVISPNEEINGIVIVFSSDALSLIFPNRVLGLDQQLFFGNSVEGSIVMTDAMSYILAEVLKDKRGKPFDNLYYLGAIYRLLSLVMEQTAKK